MNTITAKELRDNLGEIAKRVSAGEHIRVSYRNKPVFRLEPAEPVSIESQQRFGGLKALRQAQKTAHIPNRYITGNLKQLYREDMAKKYGIK